MQHSERLHFTWWIKVKSNFTRLFIFDIFCCLNLVSLLNHISNLWPRPSCSPPFSRSLKFNIDDSLWSLNFLVGIEGSPLECWLKHTYLLCKRGLYFICLSLGTPRPLWGFSPYCYFVMGYYNIFCLRVTIWMH